MLECSVHKMGADVDRERDQSNNKIVCLLIKAKILFRKLAKTRRNMRKVYIRWKFRLEFHP